MTDLRRRSKDLWLISAGMIFLFNPCINIIDVLPDVIGIVLILFGIRKYADLSSELREAKKGFGKAAWVSLAGFFAMLFSPSADDYTKLSLAVAVWLLECIFIIPAMQKLFSGLDDLRIRLTDRGDEEVFSGAATLSSIFLVVRSAAAVLPLCMPLFFEKKEEDVISGGGGTDVESVIKVTTVICAVLSLVIGLAWLVSALKCMAVLRGDEKFIAAADEKYNSEIMTDDSLWKKRYLRRFCAVSSAAVIFLLGIPLGGKPVIPEFMFGIVTAVAVGFSGYLLSEYRKKLYVLCGVFAVLSSASMMSGYAYAGKFYELLYPYEAEGFLTAFLPYAITEAASMAVLILIFAALRRGICDMTEKCVGWSGDDVLSGRQDAEIKKKLKRRANLTFAFEIIYAFVTVAAAVMSPFGDINTLFSMGWVLRMILCMVVLVLCMWTGDGIKSETGK